MAERTRDVLLSGGAGDGMVLGNVAENEKHVVFSGERYAHTDRREPHPQDDGHLVGGHSVVNLLPVYALVV